MNNEQVKKHVGIILGATAISMLILLAYNMIAHPANKTLEDLAVLAEKAAGQ